MRRREESNYDKREYRGREGRGDERDSRDDRVRNRSRSTSRTRRRSRSPPVNDRRSSSHRHHQQQQRSSYRDLDRPEPLRDEVKGKVNKTEEVVRKIVGPELLAEQEVIEGDEDAQLAAFLGINSFASTKGQKVKGNQNNEAVDAAKKRREYRQYLYVKGSYDIPLTQDHLDAKERDGHQKKNQQHEGN